MELTILGGSGTYPTAMRACSGYLLTHDGYRVWVDAGNGTLMALQRHIGLDDVDAIWLSHAHPDHCADLYPFFFALLLSERNVPVWCAPGVGDRLAALIGEDSIDMFRSRLQWNELEPGAVTDAGPMRFEAFDAAHSTTNISLRATADGKTFCYSGDTGPNPELARAARDADLFMCEASWLQRDEGLMAPIHMRASQSGSAAREAGAARLLLTHIWPHNDLDDIRSQAGDTYRGDVELIHDAERFTI